MVGPPFVAAVRISMRSDLPRLRRERNLCRRRSHAPLLRTGRRLAY